MRRHLAAALAASAIFAAACAGSPQVYEIPPGAGAGLPEPVPAVPAFVVQTIDALTEADIALLEDTPGAAVVAPVAIQRIIAAGSGGQTPLLAAAVDPATFRSVAPLATRQADFVWEALLAGEAVVTHQGAEKLGRKGSKKIDIKGIGDIRVGAVAENASPSLADVLIDIESLPEDELKSPHVAVIGAETGVTLQVLARALRKTMPGAEVHRFQTGFKESAPVEQQYVAAGLPSTSVTGLHPVLAESLSRLLDAGDGRISLVSGFRTPERQYQLWLGALAKYGSPEAADNWVAPPGHSFHEAGLAIDLGGDLNLAAQLVQELGLPLYRPMSWEPWHFELVGTRS